MAHAPQETRTFFITTVTWGRRSVFQVDRNAELLENILQSDRQKNRYKVHAFVIMPDHLHLLLTPANNMPLEKAVQFIKGGFSFQSKLKSEIWERSFTERRLKDGDDYQTHLVYIEENPVRARLSKTAFLYIHSSASGRFELDPMPEHFSSRG